MIMYRLFAILIFALTTQVLGCGSVGGTDGGTSSEQHSKLMIEASDLSLKILAERESGKNVDEVNQQFAQQNADIDARIAKLPKLTDDQVIKLMQANAGKLPRWKRNSRPSRKKGNCMKPEKY